MVVQGWCLVDPSLLPTILQIANQAAQALEVGSKLKGALDRAQQRFGSNTTKFARTVTKHLTEWKKEGVVSDDQVAIAMEDPAVIMDIQKAILSAGRTDRQDVHDVLSRLIVGRMQTSPESLLSMTCGMASQAISYMTPNQLRILGLLASVARISPSEKLDSSSAMRWQQERISTFMDIDLRPLDYEHLESLSCVNVLRPGYIDLQRTLQGKFGDDFDFDGFQSTQLGEKLKHMWKEGDLQRCSLTTLGQLLGVVVSDVESGTRTDFKAWD